MERNTYLPELLAPAGTPEAFYAAVNAGADAVYCGMTDFSARAYAGNFDEAALSEAVLYAHLHGVKVYVTMNTQLYDREIPLFLETAAAVERSGADAVIVADMGALRLLREHFPRLSLHASTQMAVHSTKGTLPLASLGVSRVVPARELSLPDIRSMVENSPCEVEIFVHGALCVSHSGQCLMSAMIGGRSGNRGSCAQPCRLPYNGESYPLSLRDLSLADHIPEIIASGVSSLKIEGRMKSPFYVFGVTKTYRRLLDENRAATPEENRALREIFSRSGFTDGYFTGKKDAPMTGIRTDEDKATARTLPPDLTKPQRVKVTGELALKTAEKANLTLHYKGKSVTVFGDVPTAAHSAPLTASALRARISKMGDTLFSLAEEDLAVTLDERLFLPVSAQNDLRRRATDALAEAFRFSEGHTPQTSQNAPSPAPKAPLTDETPVLLFSTAEGLSAADRARSDGRNTAPSLRFLLLSELASSPVTPDGVILPPVVFDSEESAVRDALVAARARGVTYAMCDNLAHFALAREADFIPYGGFRLNIRNRESYETYRRVFGMERAVLSPELTFPQARDVGGAVIVYGKLPLMLLERCFIRETASCTACETGRAALTDRTGARFPLVRIAPHRNLLLNSLPTYARESADRFRAAHLTPVLLFTNETEDEIRAVCQAWNAGASLPFPTRGLGITPPKDVDTGGTGAKKKDTPPMAPRSKYEKASRPTKRHAAPSQKPKKNAKNVNKYR